MLRGRSEKKNIEQLEYYCVSTQHRIWSNSTREQIPIFILNYISTNIYSESFNLCFVMSVYKHKIPNVSLFSYFPIDQQTFQIPGPWKRYPLRGGLGFSPMLFGAILGSENLVYKFVCNHTKLIFIYYLAVAPIKRICDPQGCPKVAHETHEVRTKLLQDTSKSLQVL